jgi:SAM-dependent methyltransferase
VTTETSAYSGHENLEIMEDAVNYNAWLVRLATSYLPKTGRVLDFGAGTGTLTRQLKAVRPDIAALEPDASQARALLAQGVPVVGSVEEIADGSLAGIASFNVLEHIEDDAGTVRILARKLRPGGVMFVYVPAFAVLYGEMDRRVGHVRRYRRGPLRQLMQQAGLQVGRCRHADSLGFFAALALRLLGPGDGTLNPALVKLYDRALFPISRAFDLLTGGSFGKNLFVVATRPTA